MMSLDNENGQQEVQVETTALTLPAIFPAKIFEWSVRFPS